MFGVEDMKEMSNKIVNQKPRMANLEILRCLAMMMVVVLHYLDKGNILPKLTDTGMNATGMTAWFLEVLCIVAVNVYMMISGYFLCTSSFKISRLLQLWLQVWMYSVVVGLIAAFTGILPATEVDTHYYLTLLFPISMGHYWFMTAYVFLYLLLPLIGAGIRKMTKEQMQLTLILLLAVFCLTKTILPVRLEKDGQGVDCLWYVCVFVTAAYIRRFGVKFLESKARALGLYIAACLAIMAEAFVLRAIYLRTGSLERLLKISLEYNHLFPFLASVGLFVFFLKVKASGRIAGFFVKIAPYTLGVYLLHENEGVRYAWENWLFADKVNSVGGLLLGTIVAVACVFACGIIVEWLRTFLLGKAHKMLGKLGWYGRLFDRITAMDQQFLLKE